MKRSGIESCDLETLPSMLTNCVVFALFCSVSFPFKETANAAVIVPNFTEFGWGLTQAPDLLTMDIRQAIYEGLPNARSEGRIDVIAGPEEPLFIDRPDLNKRALEELKPILEAWSGVELEIAQAYGFRLYR